MHAIFHSFSKSMRLFLWHHDWKLWIVFCLFCFHGGNYTDRTNKFYFSPVGKKKHALEGLKFYFRFSAMKCLVHFFAQSEKISIFNPSSHGQAWFRSIKRDTGRHIIIPKYQILHRFDNVVKHNEEKQGERNLWKTNSFMTIRGTFAIHCRTTHRAEKDEKKNYIILEYWKYGLMCRLYEQTTPSIFVKHIYFMTILLLWRVY